MSVVAAQAPDSSTATLESVFSSDFFETEPVTPIRWTADGQAYFSYDRREETLGPDLVRVNPESGEKTGGPAVRPSTLMFAKFSPQDDRVAYVRENNIYVERVCDGKITQLTRDGSRTLVNGTFDWVYEEEFDNRDGFRWMQLTGDPRNIYLARLEWAASNTEIVMQHLNHLQNTLTILVGDVKTGRTAPIMVERDSTWVDVVDDWVWLDRGGLRTHVLQRHDAAGYCADPAAVSRGGAHAGRQCRAQAEVRAAAEGPEGFRARRRGQRRLARRPGDVSRRVRLNQEVPDVVHGLRRAREPDRSGQLGRGEGTTLHLFSLLTRFLTEHLPADAR